MTPYGVHAGRNTEGIVRIFVANHETEFKNLTFWTYYKIVKLRDSQLEAMELEKRTSFWIFDQ